MPEELNGTDQVFPDINELLPYALKAIIPHSLVEELTERYETLGAKYLTEKTWPDGRRINGMVYTDRIVNCREEIVDGVFCIIGQIFKDLNWGGREPSNELYDLLRGLIEAYTLCVLLESNSEYTNVSS